MVVPDDGRLDQFKTVLRLMSHRCTGTLTAKYCRSLSASKYVGCHFISLAACHMRSNKGPKLPRAQAQLRADYWRRDKCIPMMMISSQRNASQSFLIVTLSLPAVCERAFGQQVNFLLECPCQCLLIIVEALICNNLQHVLNASQEDRFTLLAAE